ncbi:MAG: hypothetical protein JWR11_487 [Mycobacterium sp.]|nr:hypothetical protein [Mycobacterium sp.]
MTQRHLLTTTHRAGFAVLGIAAAATLSFAAPAGADTNEPCATVNSTTTGTGDNQTTTGTGGGGCIPDTSGPDGIGPGGPAYNGIDPRG